MANYRILGALTRFSRKNINFTYAGDYEKWDYFYMYFNLMNKVN